MVDKTLQKPYKEDPCREIPKETSFDREITINRNKKVVTENIRYL